MKKKITQLILILGYSIPYVFLAMNEDATCGTPWFYFVMIFILGAFCFSCIRTKNSWVVFVGNILSFVSSFMFAWNFQTEKWEYYFKPFLPNQLIVFETIIVFVIQIVFVMYYKNKEK